MLSRPSLIRSMTLSTSHAQPTSLSSSSDSHTMPNSRSDDSGPAFMHRSIIRR